MSWNPSEDEEQQSALLPWKGKPIPAPASARLTLLQKFGHFAAKIYYSMKGYAWEDINRLKEAGVLNVEAKAAKDFAEADEKIGNAARAHAEAEKAYAEAAQIRSRTATEQMEAQVRAILKVEEAVSKIRQQGGEVALDSAELHRLVYLVGRKFPDDPALKLDDDSGANTQPLPRDGKAPGRSF